jgi:hypothetical protein
VLDLRRGEKYIANSPARLQAGPNDITIMHQLRFSNLFIRLIPALAKGGGQPAHA